MSVVIWCFLPVLLMIWHSIILKKRESISWEIKRGIICWECKERFDIPQQEIWKKIGSEKEHTKICDSCNRDIKIKSLKNKFFSYRKSFREYLISEKSNKLNYIFISTILFLITLDVVLKFQSIDINGIQWLYGGINIFYWSIILYKSYIITIKKPSENSEGS
jgi:hypothetical protein